jgi:hypothetical protein
MRYIEFRKLFEQEPGTAPINPVNPPPMPAQPDGPEAEKIKDRVIRALNKKRADDPIFDKVYKTIIGPQLDNRIQRYIAKHKDADIGASEMSFLIKQIPQLGTTPQVKDFVEKWNKGADYINIEALIPKAGMNAKAPLSSVVADGIPKALFQTLAKNPGAFKKSDAGPAEGALAMMSNKISYAEKGGDLVISGQKIEIKGGGKGKGGGRVYNDRKGMINQSGMTDVLRQVGYTGNVTLAQGMGTKPVPENFPSREFTSAMSTSFFGRIVPELTNTWRTPQFRLNFNKAMYDDYQQSAGHIGILIIGANNYQYITNGEQLTTVTGASYLYYPNARQPRDMGIQVKVN